MESPAMKLSQWVYYFHFAFTDRSAVSVFHHFLSGLAPSAVSVLCPPSQLNARQIQSTITPLYMPGVGVIVRVVGLGSLDPEFKSHLAFELIPGGVHSACHPSEVGKMSASLLVSCIGVATCPGLCPIAKETA